jgi:hypothetical protein
MKRLILSGLCISVFFLGIGSLVDRVGARFKSDERALELIAKARQAIGGDVALGNIQSMRIVGRTIHTIKIDGTDRSQSGETEIALQLPDKLMKMTKIGDGDGAAGGKRIVNREVDLIRVGKPGEKWEMKLPAPPPATPGGPERTKVVVVKKDDGTTQTLTGAEAEAWIAAHPDLPAKKDFVIRKGEGDGETKHFVVRDLKDVDLERNAAAHGKLRQNEMLRMTLGLLLSAPQGIDVSYTYGGESTIDGIACNVVNAAFGGETFKLFLNRSSNLPVAMNYTAIRMPKLMRFAHANMDDAKKDVITRRHDGPPAHEATEFQVRFADYRVVGGVQFPHKLTTYAGGNVDETFEVTTYEINPANIAEQFDNEKVVVRTKQ